MKKILILAILLVAFLLFPEYAPAQSLTIIYSGQTGATLFPCHCPVEPAGGVARRGTKIKELREKNPNLLLVEVGGSFAGGPRDSNKQTEQLDKQRTFVYLKALKLMGYDVISVGDGFFRYGKKFLRDMIKKTRLNFISLNINSLKSHIIKDIDGLKVAVIGFGGYDLGCLECSDLDKLKKLIKKLKKKGVNFVIVLNDHSLDYNSKIAREVKGVNCIITTALRSKNKKQVIKLKNTLIALSYWQARRLSRLDLEIEGGKIIDFKSSEIKLIAEVPDDAVIARLLEKYPKFKR